MTTKVAHSYLDNVYKLHGLLEAIISDRDPIFTNNFWRALFKTIVIELNMSKPYHFQTERVNQSLEINLRCVIHACPSR